MSSNLPSQEFSIRNGGVGLVGGGTLTPLLVGYATGKSANSLHLFTSKSAAIDGLVSGPLVPIAAAIADKTPILVLVTAATTAGSAGAVTKAAVGSSTGTITVAGTPPQGWRVRVVITLTGTTGAGKFKYSLDGYSNTAAYTWSGEYTIPTGGTFVLPGTGLTLTFVPGAGTTYFETGDLHRFECTAPHYTTSDLTAAFAYLVSAAAKEILGTRRIRRVIMAGQSATASAAMTLAAAVSGHLDTLAMAWHFARSVIDGGSGDTVGNFKTAKAAFASDRVAVVFGKASIINQAAIQGDGVLEVPFSDAVGERFAGSQISENLGRVLSGALRGVMRITHNEVFEQAFTDSDRVITARTHDNEAGFFINNGFLSSSQSSDFKYMDWGLLMDEWCEAVHDKLQKYTLENFDAKTDGTGQLSDTDASMVETSVQLELNARIMQPINKSGKRGHATACRAKTDRLNDFYGTGRVQMFGYLQARRPAETFAVSVGLVREIPA
jgi:hypothetical protein